MRVLLLFPVKDGQTGVAIKLAFENLGHDVEVVDANRKRTLSHPTAIKYKPDLVFCSRTTELTEELVKIKKGFPRALTCVWNVDTRDTIAEWEHLFLLIRTTDYYFVVGKRLVPKWRRINPRTYWLPQGLQDGLYRKPREFSDADRERHAVDVAFAGKLTGVHNWRVPFINTVRNAGFNRRFWGCLCNPKIFGEEHNKMAFLAKINLGMSGWPRADGYTSVRNYKILGAGGFLLERNGDGLGSVFPLGKDGIMDTYTTPEDLVRKIRYWLANDEERKAVAKRGFEWVRKNATYTDRIRQAIKIMGYAS